MPETQQQPFITDPTPAQLEAMRSQEQVIRTALNAAEAELDEHADACPDCSPEDEHFCELATPMVRQMNLLMVELMRVGIPRMAAEGNAHYSKIEQRQQRARERFLAHNQLKHRKSKR